MIDWVATFLIRDADDLAGGGSEADETGPASLEKLPPIDTAVLWLI